MSKTATTFLFHYRHWLTAKALPAEARLRFYDMLLDYGFEGKTPDEADTSFAAMMVRHYRKEMDRRAARLERIDRDAERFMKEFGARPSG